MLGKALCAAIAVLAFASICAAVEKEHEMCCTSCVSKYSSSTNLESACLRGCRLYGMIFLAHDRSVERSEIAGLCSKSCAAAAGAGAPAACADGCAQQERVFRERRVTDHTAKLAVMMGLPDRPEVRSPAPYHSRMFNRTPLGPTVWLRAVQIRVRPLPAGPDGRPRYWVEMSEHAVPLRLAAAGPANMLLPPAHDTSQLRRRHGNATWSWHHRWGLLPRVPERARVGIRWAACALLAMSLIGLLWLLCGVCTAGRRLRVHRLAAGSLLRKQPLPSVQSGDIYCIGAADNDKKPLLLAADDAAHEAKAKEAGLA